MSDHELSPKIRNIAGPSWWGQLWPSYCKSLLLVMALSCSALATHTCTTCYIDPSPSGCGGGGCSDSNSGATKLLAWVHAPGMTGATGNASTQAPAAGDSYLTRGGTVSTLSTSNTWHQTHSGSSGNVILWGTDPTWNLGKLVSITPLTSGFNCTSLTVVISGGGGSSGAATANFETSGYLAGLLQHVTITNAGSGYTSNPTVSFTGSCTTFPTAVADITRPVFDATGTVWTESNGAQTSFGPVVFSGNFVTLDSLEFRGAIFDHAISNALGSLSLFTYQFGTNVTANNMYWHNTGNDEPLGFNGTVTVSGTTVTKTSGDSFITGSVWNGQAISINGAGCTIASVTSATVLTLSATCGSSGPYFKNTFNGTSLTNFNQGSSPANVSVTNSFADNYENELQVACGYNGDGSFAGFAPPCGSSQGIIGVQTLTGNVVHDCRGCVYSPAVVQNLNYSNNVIWANTWDCCIQHEDAFYFFGGGVISNNIVHDLASGAAALYIELADSGGNCNQTYTFNNVVYNVGQSTPPIGHTGEFYTTPCTGTDGVSTPTMFDYNNTFYSLGGIRDCINWGQQKSQSAAIFNLYNNHCISDQSAVHWFDSNGSIYGTVNGVACSTGGCANAQSTVDPQNTVMSPTTATSQGYVFGNSFAPTLLTNSTVTAALSNFTSTCSTSTNGVSLTGLCTGILGNARPNAAWQSGAYQFAGAVTVTTPTFSPIAGTYSSSQSVTISTTTGGATLCYTTDGTTPTANGAGTCTHGTTYSTAVTVSASETLKAIGSLSGDTDSSVGSAIYTISAAAPSSVISNGVINGGFVH